MRNPNCAATPSRYEQRRPESATPNAFVAAHLERFLAAAREHHDRGLPRSVERELRAYLQCGIHAYGFLRARCSACGAERLVAFSCKRRGVCPSCNARRMCAAAAHFTDHVLPDVPLRQWVLSVPFELRLRLAKKRAGSERRGYIFSSERSTPASRAHSVSATWSAWHSPTPEPTTSPIIPRRTCCTPAAPRASVVSTSTARSGFRRPTARAGTDSCATAPGHH
ncbi:MAG: hypothetical protein EOO73_13675 [Myxococcales bacterium]|nr:MAG: hypothetical protein EOO73_13675 [Myxococcales bacterium]